MRINILTKEELIANTFDLLAEYPGSNSAIYLSVEVLISSVEKGKQLFKNHKMQKQKIMIQENENSLKSFKNNNSCTACLTGLVGIVTL